jgi:hypothetical protein
VSENRVLRKFGSKRVEVAGGWRRLHNEFRNVYTSPKIIRAINPRSLKWSGYAARMGEMRNVYKILVERPEVRDHSEDLGVDEIIIFEWMLDKYVGKMWIGFMWLRIGTSDGLL